eukprot:5479484-Heterocapsa_arctica.AAC.1
MAPVAPAAPTAAAEQLILNPLKPEWRPWSCPSTSSTGPFGRHRARQDLRAQPLPLHAQCLFVPLTNNSVPGRLDVLD